jgi:NAD(P)H-dependent FMN reductase
MVNIQIVVGSIRPGRNGDAVGKWVYDIAKKRKDIKVELVDLADYDLPLFNEPISPAYAPINNENAKKWAAKINQADGYVFVTPEYNHGMPASLKNAVDWLFSEWNDKAIGFVGYGSAGGARSIEQFRQVSAEVHMADVRTQVLLSLVDDFENMSVFKPRPHHEQTVNIVLDQVANWAKALKPLREKEEATGLDY